ncbi:hypothetical protein LX16_1850 [Stackebrandtia albiflava]|uniref:Uncharacterized protein n=1 Tax=Stackebrandtia albiflava TaxID=406432 RepID=A0A562VE12_9ACTN|nr:hypothetical protein [Stackebrandtia albiflava]TWJ16126.1 hypothetical protein LX16_1850 [Stackebrandtia albiflava]
MITVEELMRDVTVRAVSPDRSVGATMTMRDGITVRFAPGCRDRHTPAGLAVQVEAAVNQARDGYRAAERQRLDRALGEGERRRLEESETGRFLAPLFKSFDTIDVTATSPKNVVKIRWTGDRLHVGYRLTGPLPPEVVLTEETDAALAAVVAAYGRRAVALYERFMANDPLEDLRGRTE